MSTYFITGANRGLGLEFARQLTARGDTVLAACRNPDAAVNLGALASDRLRIVKLDVADPRSIDAAARAVGVRVDVLINNAAITGTGENIQRLDGADGEVMVDVFRTNVVGPTLVLKAMLASGAVGDGSLVVNVSSGAGSIAGADGTNPLAYATSKAALNMASKIAAGEVADRGVTVVMQNPGWVRTDMGGPGANIDPPESIERMLPLIDGYGPSDNGKFYGLDGNELPW